MNILSAALLPILFLYAGFLCYLVWALARPRRGSLAVGEKKAALPGVSIVIPFRNEAPHLRQLIASLKSQTYAGASEILLINDGSTDDFQDVLAACRAHAPIRVIDSAFSAERRLTSKQQALDCGIRGAAYDWIALTDADMVLEPGWLQTLVETAQRGADLVFGHTAMKTGSSPKVFRWFQSFQLETLFAFAYALNRGGIMGSCMGNNLLLSRKAYLQVGGFDALGYSITEDRELLAAVWKKKLRIAPVEPFHAAAITFPAPSAKGYYQQLLRWTYGGFGKSSNLSLLAAVAGGQNIALLVALTGILPVPVAVFAFCNMALTWIFVAAAFRKMRSKENALLWLPFSIVLLGETLLLIVSFIFRRPVTWKDRRI